MATTELRQLGAQLRRLAGTSQFYWYLSHVLAVWFMTLALLSSMLYGNMTPGTFRYYRYSVTSIIATYLIVIRETFRGQPVSLVVSQPAKLVRDENVQYLVLAVLLRIFASKEYGAVNVTTLQPFCLYGLFHSLEYFQKNILPFVPYLSAALKQQVGQRIVYFVKSYRESSLMLAANLELLMAFTFTFQMLRCVLSMQLLRPAYFAVNLKTLVLWAAYVVFDKFRYESSKYTQTVVNDYDARLCQVVYNDHWPAGFRNVLQQARQGFCTVMDRIQLPKQNKTASGAGAKRVPQQAHTGSAHTGSAHTGSAHTGSAHTAPTSAAAAAANAARGRSSGANSPAE